MKLSKIAIAKRDHEDRQLFRDIYDLLKFTSSFVDTKYRTDRKINGRARDPRRLSLARSTEK